MKPEGQIKHKLAQVRFRHLKRETRTGLSRRSGNCKFNGLIDLPGHENLGVCLHSAEDPACWNGGSCDDTLDDRASRCPLFETLNTKESIRDEFDSFLEKADRAHIAERYPDMAALLWVLDLDKPGDLPEEDESELEGVQPTTPQPEAEPTPEVAPQPPAAEPAPAAAEPVPEELAEPQAAVEPWSAIPTPVPPPSEDLPVLRSGLLGSLVTLWALVMRFFRHG